MKEVEILYTYSGAVAPGILLTDTEDLPEIQNLLDIKSRNISHKMLRSDVDLKSMDSSCFSSAEKGIALLAIERGRLKGTNPLFEVIGSSESYMSGLIKNLGRDGRIVINRNGGYCLPNDQVRIRRIVGDADAAYRPDVAISAASDVIILENDPMLEKTAIRYCSDVYGEYSYITELYRFSFDELMDLLKTFSASVSDALEKTEKTLYVYTTAGDIEQMYFYLNAALSAGISQYVIHLSAGRPIGFEQLTKWFEEAAKRIGKNISLKILDNLNK